MSRSVRNVVFCDGGLCNRLNALIFAFILRDKFGGEWEMSWPRNNWCGASFARLFVTDMPTLDEPLDYYKAREDSYRLVMHENQCGFRPERLTLHSQLAGYEGYARILHGGEPLLYYHNLIPACATLEDIRLGLKYLRVVPEIHGRAAEFCRANQIDDSVVGLHIRKTDFGSAVDDRGLFELAARSARRFFVCSDDPEVNARFSGLPNCAVFEKHSFPEKMVLDSSWNARTVDDQGRVFGFNITRSPDAIADALVDLLILSRTTHVATSHSTFLRMSMIFKATGFFVP